MVHHLRAFIVLLALVAGLVVSLRLSETLAQGYAGQCAQGAFPLQGPGGFVVCSNDVSNPSATVQGGMNIGSAVNVSQATVMLHTIRSSGNTPSIGPCGVGPVVVGTDMAGEITTGTNTFTCTMTFLSAYNAAPFCVLSWRGNLSTMNYIPSSANLVFVQSLSSANKVNYHCIAQPSG